jgi:hypothetical protein
MTESGTLLCFALGGANGAACADSGLDALAANAQANLIAVGTRISRKRESDCVKLP